MKSSASGLTSAVSRLRNPNTVHPILALEIVNVDSEAHQLFRRGKFTMIIMMILKTNSLRRKLNIGYSKYSPIPIWYPVEVSSDFKEESKNYFIRCYHQKGLFCALSF